MFSYYGSKSKLAKLYPPPKHRLIIEPFAGSARYSLLHFDNEVRLYDMSHYVYEVWRYLIDASTADIRGLPDVPSKVCLDTYQNLTEAERYLIGFGLCRGKAKPRRTGHGQNSWAADKERIASNLYKIKHWAIFRGRYTDIPNQKATWFIDQPYRSTQLGNSDRYPHWQIDYDELAGFVRSRKGLTISCENDDATYLPFKFLTKVNANTNSKSVKKINEMVYIQEA